MPINTLIELRADTAANWTAVNPILGPGEVGVETDTGWLKIGDGSTDWLGQNYSSDPVLQQAVAALQGASTGYATLDSPAFTGIPTCPTPPVGDYGPTIVNSQWVIDAITRIVGTLPGGVPVNSSAPVATLDPVLGTTATVTTGTWTDTPTLPYVYQWAWSATPDGASPTNITVGGSGYNTATYTVQAGDTGRYLLCFVTAANTFGSSLPATSRATLIVGGPPAAPVNTVIPVITGTPTQGQTLTTTDGTWTGSPTLTYQWKQLLVGGSGAGTPIAGATGTTYVLQATDVGQTIYVAVTGTNAGGTDVGYSTPPVGPIVGSGSGPVNTAGFPPTVTGTPTRGQTLTATNGTWTGTAPITYTRQWQTLPPGTTGAGTNIPGATGTTYLLTANEVGLAVRVQVTATNGSGSTTAPSAATATIGSGGGGTLLWAPTFKVGQAPIRGSASEWVSLGSNWIGSDITCVADPLGSGTPVYKFSVPNGDRPSTGKPRADLCSGTGIAEGSTVFVSIPIYLPTGVPGVNVGIPVFGSGGSNYCQWAEWKDTIGSSPYVSLMFQGVGGVQCFVLHNTNGVFYWSYPVDNKWHCAVMAGVWSRTNPPGYFNMWWDGNPVTFNTGSTKLPVQTLGCPGTQVGPGPQPLDINSYRAADYYSGTLVTYHGKPKMGTSLTSVLPDSGRWTGP